MVERIMMQRMGQGLLLQFLRNKILASTILQEGKAYHLQGVGKEYKTIKLNLPKLSSQHDFAGVTEPLRMQGVGTNLNYRN